MNPAVHLAHELAEKAAQHPIDVQHAAAWMLLEGIEVERRAERASMVQLPPPVRRPTAPQYGDLELHADKIVEFTRKRGGRVTSAELLEEQGCSHETLRHRVNAAIKSGRLVRATRGVFELVVERSQVSAPKRTGQQLVGAKPKQDGRALTEVEDYLREQGGSALAGDVAARFGLDTRVVISRCRMLCELGRARFNQSTGRYELVAKEVSTP